MFTKLLTSVGLTFARWLPRVTGFFSGWRLLWVIVPVLVSVSAGSFWAGKRWSEGGNAIRQLESLDARITQFNQKVDEAYATALQFEQARQIIDEFYINQDQELRDYVSANRERLSECDIGPDGLRLWNQWNQGPAAAEDTAQPGNRVP